MRDARFLSGGLRMLLAVGMLGSLAGRPPRRCSSSAGASAAAAPGTRADSAATRPDRCGRCTAGSGCHRGGRSACGSRSLPLPDFSYSTPRDERFNRATDPALRVAPRIDITTRENRRQLAGGEATLPLRRSAAGWARSWESGSAKSATAAHRRVSQPDART